MRALLCINSRARRGRLLAERVRAELALAGIEFVEGGPASGRANLDAVVVAGGDGSIVRMAPEAIEANLPLGIVPLGTFNDLAQTLGIPLDIREACATIAAGATRAIDVGRVNGVHYVNEASVGLSARIARRQTTGVKRRLGALGIVTTTLQSLRDARPFHARLLYGDADERVRTNQITVANSHHFGGVLYVEDAAIDDGLLDLFSFEARTWGEALRGAIEFALPGNRHVERLRRRTAPRFEIRTPHPHRIEADGEPAGFTPAVFEVLPRALRVLVPATADGAAV